MQLNKRHYFCREFYNLNHEIVISLKKKKIWYIPFAYFNNTHMKKLLFVSLLSVALFSCKDQTVTTIELNDIALTAEGPYFEGPNSFQATLSNTLKNNNINPENVDKIVLISAVITLPDSIEDGLIQDFSLQLVSSNSEMKKVAFINPIPVGKKEIELTIAQEQDDIDAIFSKEELISLLDANFSKDLEANLEFKVKLIFNITTN